ncbi:MAG: transcription repressor NadR [Veillonella sp.]|uniref:transcription repressor NadR n=1 Tax=Veillonella sp. TaxID=1926307 RepID=UPI0025FCC621|nr:transcription repressor NadR [Veillonella sp.]MBS4913421.1 transcription repressor NadR [Veillonella sp.]
MNKKEKRRQGLLSILSQTTTPLTGEVLAQSYGVTRQVIVNDMAALRDAGYPIQSTVKGYEISKVSTEGILRTITCRHTPEDTLTELHTIIELGGMVHNVSVTHDVYGNLTAPLPIKTEADIEGFLNKQKNSASGLLSKLNNGLHTHLIEAPTLEAMERIIKTLQELHIVIAPDE